MEEKEQPETQIPTESAAESNFKKVYDSLLGNVDDLEEITPATIDEEEKSRNEMAENGITRSKQEIIQPSNVSLDLKDEEIVDIEELEEDEEKAPFVPLVIQKDPEETTVTKDIPLSTETLVEESPERPIDLIAPETLSPAPPLLDTKPLEVVPEPLLEATQSIPLQTENSQEINSTEPQVALEEEEPQEEQKEEEQKKEEMDIVEKESPQEKNESQALSTQELSTQETEQLPKEDKETSSSNRFNCSPKIVCNEQSWSFNDCFKTSRATRNVWRLLNL